MKTHAGVAALLAGMAAAPLSFAPMPAFAQEGAVVEEGDIVVTARRREESLQDVPLAVTTFSAEALEATGAADITALTRATPNVTFEVSRGTNSTLTAFIRGVGQQDPLWGFEPGVGLYVDDVYIARPQGALLDIYDVERLEVLRGPQGTLYGRNTIGGAIKYVTARIGDEPQGKVKLNAGSYGQADVIVSGSTPLGGGFALGAAFASFNREGYGTNLTTGAEHYNKDVEAARVTLEYAPVADLFFRLAYDRTQDDSNAKHGHRLLPSRDGTILPTRNPFDTRGAAGDDNSVVTEGASFQAEWAVSDALTLKSITAWRDGDTTTPIDFDALPQPDLDVPAYYQDEQFTQEIQALFDVGPLSGVVGAYYLNGVANGAFDTVLGTTRIPGLFPNGLTVFASGKVNTLSTSYFGDVTWDISDQLSLSVGGRYTSDEKTAAVVRQNFNGVRSTAFGNATATPVGAPLTNFRRSRTDDKFSPRVSISYEPSSALTVYGAYSQGFKSGGFDPRANFGATPAVLQPAILAGFKPEIVDSYEVGAKGVFFDNRLRLNSAIFLSDYTDQQVTVQSGVDTNGDGVNDNIVSSIFNAGSTEYRGVELEGTFQAAENFRLGFAIGYIDAQVKEVISNGVNVQKDATRFNDFVPQNTPEWTSNLNATWTLDVAGGALDITGAASYRSEYYIFNTVLNEGFGAGVYPAFPGGGPRLDADATRLFDLSAVWTAPDERFTIGLHGKNLTDELYRVALYNFAYARNQATGAIGAPTGIDSSYSAFYGPPRTITASVQFKF